MQFDIYKLALLYLVYSFLGWVGETAVAAVKRKRFVNRGMTAGPFCFIYGFTAVLLAVGLADLRAQPVFLFLSCMLDATLVEWLAGKALEHLHRRRWWDYSGKRFNLDGYICLQYSLLWGALGTASVLWGNGLLLKLYALVPAWLAKPVLLIALGIALLDQFAAALAVSYADEHPYLVRFSRALGARTEQFGLRIEDRVERRISRAYPQPERKASASAAAAKPLTFADLVWLFVIGSFLGDIVETLYCRASVGVWMSRSSLVWGPFSVVWGLALVLAAVLLRQEPGREKTDRSIFAFGVVMGGAYEYVCSAVGEMLFGVVFWDYSGFKFNLGGRINLLYCFFWGIAAVVWIRYGYPLAAKLLDRVRRKTRPWLTAVLTLFIAANMLVSALALARYNARMEAVPPQNFIDTVLDERFPDTRMERVYPNAKKLR